MKGGSTLNATVSSWPLSTGATMATLSSSPHLLPRHPPNPQLALSLLRSPPHRQGFLQPSCWLWGGQEMPNMVHPVRPAAQEAQHMAGRAHYSSGLTWLPSTVAPQGTERRTNTTDYSGPHLLGQNKVVLTNVTEACLWCNCACVTKHLVLNSYCVC